MKKIRSKYGLEESVKRLKVEMEERGLTIFYEADHRKNAQEAKMALAGATVLFFGNPAVGTKLMQDNPEISFELPLRIAVFEEGEGVFVGYRAPTAYAAAYRLTDESGEILKKMDGLYENLTAQLK